MIKRLLPLLLLATLSSATTVKPMSIEELTAAASTVVVGQAGQSWSTWNAQHTLIYTFTRFSVARSLKGSAEQTVTVKQLGGSAGGYTQKVAGVHPLRTGDASVLFLRPSETKDGTMVIVGLMQGDFRLESDSTTRTAIVNNGVNGVRASTGTGVSDYRGSKMSLKELEARVRKAANE